MRRRSFISSLIATGFVATLPLSARAHPDARYFHSFEVAEETLKSLERSKDYWREKLDEDA